MESNHRKRILLVEDEPLYYTSMKLLLERHYMVDHADNLDDALGLIKLNHYDLVSTDGDFPKSKGESLGNISDESFRGNLVAKLTNEKGIPVIGVSSEPDRLTEVSIKLKKPFVFSDYINLVKEVLGDLD